MRALLVAGWIVVAAVAAREAHAQGRTEGADEPASRRALCATSGITARRSI